TLKSGEKYHFVGEMMRSDDWNTDSSDNYTVYVKATAIDSIEKDYVYPSANVKLNIAFASYSNMEIKSLVQTLNENLVKIANSKGENNPQFHYYISGVKIGEN
ncbi:hypothetical protein ACXOM2_09690, partial [Streptococcus thermophilus]